MLPSNTVTDAGSSSSTNGTITAGPFVGPDTWLETGLTFMPFDESLYLDDAIAQLSTGAAPTQQHAYLFCLGDATQVKFYLLGTQIPPGATVVSRHITHYQFLKGDVLYIKGVQMSGEPTAEATQLLLKWSHTKPTY